ncbi:hypothetical protein DVDV_0845 [Desulfovibrio sp. DV]|nr:hypothetical protein DVDV_0845 [Desulfovibrio sp. DV]
MELVLFELLRHVMATFVTVGHMYILKRLWKLQRLLNSALGMLIL